MRKDNFVFIGLEHENVSLYFLILQTQTVAKHYCFSPTSAVDSRVAFLSLLTEFSP